MAVILGYAYYKSCEGKGNNSSQANGEEQSRGSDPHKTAKIVGKTVAALLFAGGLATLYAFSIQGILGTGQFAHLSFKANAAICGVLAGIELLTVVGLILHKVEERKEKGSATEDCFSSI